MKKAFEITSHQHHLGGGCYEYSPIPRNAKVIYEHLTAHSVECIGMKQRSDEYWIIRLKGKKKNIQDFVRDFTILAGELYNIKETYWPC